MDATVIRSIAFGAAAGGVAGGAVVAGAAFDLASWASVFPVFTTCAVVGALIHNAKKSIAEVLENRTHTLRTRLDRIYRDVGDIHGLVRLAPYTQTFPLPLGGGWALTGDSAAVLVQEMLLRQPNIVVELGSGASTLILGQVLKRNGYGRLLSVDHDAAWANQTRRNIKFLNLQDVVTVVDAPLRSIATEDGSYAWYDIPKNDLDDLGPIDFLVVDGPPSQAEDSAIQARYPAFPVLRERLSTGSVVFVDDCNREGERNMIERWMSLDPAWRLQRFNTVDGVCILARLPPSPTVDGR